MTEEGVFGHGFGSLPYPEQIRLITACYSKECRQDCPNVPITICRNRPLGDNGMTLDEFIARAMQRHRKRHDR